MTTELARLCRDYQITATFDPITRLDDDVRAWTVTIYRHLPLKPPVAITVAYYAGIGIAGEPAADDVLAAVLEDARAEDFVTFTAWCDDLGREPDDIGSQLLYRACLQQSLRVRFLLGFDHDLFERFQRAAEDYWQGDTRDDDDDDSSGGGSPAPASGRRPSTSPDSSPTPAS